MRAFSFLVLTCVLLTACSGGDGSWFGGGTAGGPDETSVVPVQPLVIPSTLALPTPTPGGTNRSDPTAADIAARAAAAQNGG